MVQEVTTLPNLVIDSKRRNILSVIVCRFKQNTELQTKSQTCFIMDDVVQDISMVVEEGEDFEIGEFSRVFNSLLRDCLMEVDDPKHDEE